MKTLMLVQIVLNLILRNLKTITSSGVFVVALTSQAQFVGPAMWLRYQLSFLAGQYGSSGNIDGTGTAARFYGPAGIAVDSSGNIYTVDVSNSTIRKITPAGVVTTFAGTANSAGSTDGTGSAARFTNPYGIAIDASGNLYVSDRGNHTIRKITPTAVVTTLAGTAGVTGTTDATGSAAKFSSGLSGIAVDSSGNVFVSDSGNETIRKITSAGVVTTFAGTSGTTGTTDGTGTGAKFNSPYGIAIDSSNTMYICDYGNHTIRKVTSAAVVTTLAGTAGTSGSTDGTGTGAKFYYPQGIAVDSSGNLWVGDSSNSSIRQVTSAGVVTTFAGTSGSPGWTDATGTAARLRGPTGVFVDTSGNLYVADTANNAIRKITSSAVVTTIAGSPTLAGATNGTGAAAYFSGPMGLATDTSGNIYLADGGNALIRKITPAGVVTTLAGSGTAGSANGTGTAASFNYPYAVAVDSSGNVYVADTSNNIIRKITSAGVVTTLAGSAGLSGTTDGTGSAARFSSPSGVAVDSSGNIFVADNGNNTIRKVTSAGVVTTFAGNNASSGSTDGTGTGAKFYRPYNLAFDSAGNLFVTDYYNYTLRKITSAGVVTTVAGTAGVHVDADGTGTAATFAGLQGIAIDSNNNIYIAEGAAPTIRKVTPAGVVTTLVGSTSSSGVKLGYLPASLCIPVGIAVFSKTVYLTTSNAVLYFKIP